MTFSLTLIRHAGAFKPFPWETGITLGKAACLCSQEPLHTTKTARLACWLGLAWVLHQLKYEADSHHLPIPGGEVRLLVLAQEKDNNRIPCPTFFWGVSKTRIAMGRDMLHGPGLCMSTGVCGGDRLASQCLYLCPQLCVLSCTRDPLDIHGSREHLDNGWDLLRASLDSSYSLTLVL